MGGVYTRDALSPGQCRSPLASSHSLTTVGAITNPAATDDYSRCIQSAEAAEFGCQYLSFESPRGRPSVTVASPRTTITPASTASTQCTTDQLYSGLGLTSQAAIKPPVPSAHVSSLGLVPMKAGVMPPPTANVNANSSSVVSDISDASQPCLDKNASESVTQPERGWKEFEEALSEEFGSSTVADNSHQTKDVISSSYLLPPPKPLNTTMLSITLHYITLRI